MDLRAAGGLVGEPFGAAWLCWECVDGVVEGIETVDWIEPDVEPCIPVSIKFFDDARWGNPVGSGFEPGQHGVSQVGNRSDFVGDFACAIAWIDRGGLVLGEGA